MVATIVSNARYLQISLCEMKLAQYKTVCKMFEPDLYEVFNAVKSVEKKNSHGSTGTLKVKDALRAAILSLQN